MTAPIAMVCVLCCATDGGRLTVYAACGHFVCNRSDGAPALCKIEALEGNRIPCPSCRVEVCVPDGGFPVCRQTAFLRSLLTSSAAEGGEKASQSTSDIRENDDQCQLCGGDIDGKCRSCENFLCGRCALKTKCKKREMRQHDAEDIDDIFSRTSATFDAWKKKEESEVKQLEEKLQELTRIQKLHKEKTAVLESAEIALTACQSITMKLQIMTQLAGTIIDCLPLTAEVAETNIKEDTAEEKYSKLVAVHTLNTNSIFHVIGTENMAPLLYSTEDCSVSLLSKGIKLTHRSIISIPMKDPALFVFHESLGLWCHKSSTLTLYDKFRMNPTTENNDDITNLNIFDGALACAVMDKSYAYALSEDSNLIKYSLKTGQTEKIIEIVSEMDAFLWMSVCADTSPLILIAYKTAYHQRGNYYIFGKASLLQIDTVRGRLISEIDITKFLVGKQTSSVRFAAQGDRVWIIEEKRITEYEMI